jgi:hypothetical protein
MVYKLTWAHKNPHYCVQNFKLNGEFKNPLSHTSKHRTTTLKPHIINAPKTLYLHVRKEPQTHTGAACDVTKRCLHGCINHHRETPCIYQT